MNKFLLISALTSILISSKAQTLKEAIRLNENEQQEAASVMYQLLISKDPANGTNFYYYGENLIDASNTDSAKIIFDKGLSVDPTNPLNIIGQAELKLQLGLLSEAKPMIDKAIQMGGGKNARVLMEAAEAYIRYKKAQDLMSAEVYLDQALKLEPKNPEIYNLMGDLYSELNNGSVAAAKYNKALELDKTQVKALLHKGQLYKRSTNYEGAAAEFENALKIDPNFAPAYRELGEVSFMMKKIETAKGYYRQYLDLSKNNNSARLRYTYFLFTTENFKDGLVEFNNISTIDSANLGMMRLGAYLNYENSDTTNAFAFINRVFANTASDTTKRITLDYAYYGKILAKAGQDSLGAMYIMRAIQLDSTKTDYYTDLGNLYSKAKKYPEAAMAYEKRIASGQKIVTADYYKLGLAYYQGKMYPQADSAFIKVTEIQETWPNGYLYRARTNSAMDPDTKQGLGKPFYEKYIELITADSVAFVKYKRELAESNRYLGYYYLVQKDCPQSIIYFKRTLEFDPDNVSAQEILESIKSNPKNFK
ncbi:tetratricopeptide repeat protein [soil metagenome]